MDNYLYITIAILIAFSAILYVLYQTASEKLKFEKMKNEEYECELIQMENENSALRAEMKLHSKLEKETNEKISALNNGDLSPDDILPK